MEILWGDLSEGEGIWVEWGMKCLVEDLVDGLEWKVWGQAFSQEGWDIRIGDVVAQYCFEK